MLSKIKNEVNKGVGLMYLHCWCLPIRLIKILSAELAYSHMAVVYLYL